MTQSQKKAETKAEREWNAYQEKRANREAELAAIAAYKAEHGVEKVQRKGRKSK